MQIGIVGLPNVGKSTLFSALTKKQVAVSNYPFTTIDPNIGVVAVPDERLEKLAALSKSEKIVPAVVEFVDIAGLVKGANKGEGLGNQFLAQIREVDAIIEVIRAFDNPEIIHVEGQIEPLRDYEILEAELILKDLESVEKRLEKIQKEARAGIKSAQEKVDALLKMKEVMERGEPIRKFLQLKPGAIFLEELKALSLLTSKPAIVLINCSDSRSDKATEAFRDAGAEFLTLDIKHEAEALSLTKREQEELSVDALVLNRLISKSYDVLGLISFFTTGLKETRAWTISSASRAPQAAGVIHSDFEKNFIRADVINWEALLVSGGWAEARLKGLIKSKGKDYVMQDGDVVDIKHSA